MTNREFIVELCRTIVAQADEAEHQQREANRITEAMMHAAEEKKRMEARIVELEGQIATRLQGYKGGGI